MPTIASAGASNYSFAESTVTQRTADLIYSHSRTRGVLAGVPAVIVPDQLKPGVRNACRYEPILQRTYEKIGRALWDGDSAGETGESSR